MILMSYMCTTIFCIPANVPCVRFSSLFAVDQMNRLDEELKKVIQNLWPVQAKKMLPLLVPANDGMLMISGLSPKIKERVC